MNPGLQYETSIRLGLFLGVFAVMAVWELARPRRPLSAAKSTRWLSNISIVLINTVSLRLLFSSGAVGMAWIAAERGWGLFNILESPFWVAFIVSIVALDFLIYIQHVVFHALPAIWRLHMVHHADLDFDVTTGARFHPLEMIISMLIKLGAVAALGAPSVAVLTFEVLLNATAMFNHSNVRIPEVIDRWLRWLVVTPDMHRVHHSVIPAEANRNFGFNLPWWDRLLGTYKDQPTAGHEGMTIGLRQFRDSRRLTLPWMLALPFIGESGGYSRRREGHTAHHLQAKER